MASAPGLKNKPRPINLNLATLHFPVMAVVSILHRLSGVLLFLFVPFLLNALSRSLNSPDDFYLLQSDLHLPAVRFCVWLFLSGLLYHMLAGIRHLVMDIGYAETLRGGRISAFLVMGLSVLGTILLGIWLW